MSEVATRPQQSHRPLNERPRWNHRETKTSASGFIRLVGPKEPVGFTTKEKQFFGLLAPGNHISSGQLMARAIVPAHSCPEWFQQFLETLTETDFFIRASLIGVSFKAPLAFFIPKANNLKQLKLENKRWHEERLNVELPSIADYEDAASLSERVYREFANRNSLLVVQKIDHYRGGPAAVAINTKGEILRLSGGHNVWNFTDGIAKGVTTLEAETALAIEIEHLGAI